MRFRALNVTILSFAIAITAKAESPAVVDANGALLGSYLGPHGVLPDDNEITATRKGPVIGVVSTKGYIFSIGQATGKVLTSGAAIPSLWPESQSTPGLSVVSTRQYNSTDCTGQAYVSVYAYGSGDVGLLQNLLGGFVLAEYSTPTQLLYVPKTATVQQVDINSRRWLGNCELYDAGINPSLPVFPNDPEVTGVLVPQSPAPITISQLVVPRPLFKNGFELQAGSS